MNNHSRHKIPGCGAEVAVTKSRRAPGWWTYTVFDGDGKMVGSDAVDLSGLAVRVTADQVARIAYILET